MANQARNSDQSVLITPLKAAAKRCEQNENIDARSSISATPGDEPRKKTFLPQVHADALDWGTFNNDENESEASSKPGGGNTVVDESSPTRESQLPPFTCERHRRGQLHRRRIEK